MAYVDGIKYLIHCLEKKNSYQGFLKNYYVELKVFGNRFSLKVSRVEPSNSESLNFTKLLDVELNNTPEERILAIKLCKEYLEGAKIESQL